MSGSELIRVIVIGADGHGKHMLTAALVSARAATGHARPTEVTSSVEYRTARRRCIQLTAQPGGDVARSVFAMPRPDVAVVVVSMETGVTPQTEEHILLARCAGVERSILVINHDHREADPELSELAIAEGSATIARSGLTVEAFVVGSIPRALDAPASPEARRCIDELAAELDHVPLAPRDDTGPFIMSLQQRFTLRGRGSCAVGTVERGAVQLGEEIELLGPDHRQTTCCTMMEVDGQSVEEARAGDELGALLRGVDSYPLCDCTVLCSPGAIDVHERFCAELHVLDEAIGTDAALSCLIHTSKRVARLVTPRPLAPGQTAHVDIVLDRPVPLPDEAPLALRRGSRILAVGRARIGRAGDVQEMAKPAVPAQPSSDRALDGLLALLPGVGSATLRTFVGALLDDDWAAKRALDDVDTAITHIDAQVERQLQPIIRHPSVRHLHRIWHEVHALVAPPGVVVSMLDASRAELCEDFDDSPSVDRSGLWSIVYSAAYGGWYGEPYAAMVIDEPLGSGAEDRQLLRSIGVIAHQSCTVLIAAAPHDELAPELAAESAGPFLMLTDRSPYEVAADIRDSFERYGWGAHAPGRTVAGWLSDTLVLSRFAQTMMRLHRDRLGIAKTAPAVERLLTSWLLQYDHLVEARLSIDEASQLHGRFLFELSLHPRWSSHSLTLSSCLFTE